MWKIAAVPITLSDTYILGRNLLLEGSGVAEASTCITHNNDKRETSMSWTGFEPVIPASERPQTYALYYVATGIDTLSS
jgi:hypothetical protein